MTDRVLDFQITPTHVEKSSHTYSVFFDSTLVDKIDQNFDANSRSFWFRFFGEIDVLANRFEQPTDVTFHLAVAEGEKVDRKHASSVLNRLSKRAAWGKQVDMLASANIDAIYISVENLKSEEAPRLPSVEEAERLGEIQAAFAQMLDTSRFDEETQKDLATKIVMDLLIGEFGDDERGALATVVGVWLGNQVAALTGLEWHCIDENDVVTYCIHNPATKISCFPFDAINKRLNSQEAFQPHLLAATFADGLSGQARELH